MITKIDPDLSQFDQTIPHASNFTILFPHVMQIVFFFLNNLNPFPTTVSPTPPFKISKFMVKVCLVFFTPPHHLPPRKLFQPLTWASLASVSSSTFSMWDLLPTLCNTACRMCCFTNILSFIICSDDMLPPWSPVAAAAAAACCIK